METKKLLYRVIDGRNVYEVWLDLETGLAYNVFELMAVDPE